MTFDECRKILDYETKWVRITATCHRTKNHFVRARLVSGCDLINVRHGKETTGILLPPEAISGIRRIK